MQSTILEKVRKYFRHHRLFSEEFVVNASHLKENEKRELLHAYETYYIKNKNKAVPSSVKAFKQSYQNILSEKEKSKVIECKTGFPLACRLFFYIERFHDMGYMFFSKPDENLLEEIETMRKCKNLTYIVLAYVLIKGKMNPQDQDRKLLTDICTKVDLPHNKITPLKISDAVDELTRAYIEKDSSTGEYLFTHATVLDNVLLSFGKVAPEIVLKGCSRRCLYELIRTPKHNEISYTL